MEPEKGFDFDFDSVEGKVIIKGSYEAQLGKASLSLEVEHKELLRAMVKSSKNSFDNTAFKLIYGEEA